MREEWRELCGCVFGCAFWCLVYALYFAAWWLPIVAFVGGLALGLWLVG